jgi:hypothetical protein
MEDNMEIKTMVVSIFMLCTLIVTTNTVYADYTVCKTPKGQEYVACDNNCKGDTFISRGSGSHWSCNISPSDDIHACKSKYNINATGYPKTLGGHKTKWCQAQGFDGYDDNGFCTRTCPSACVKAAVLKLGWRDGHKTKFCHKRGYDGHHNPYEGNYRAGGYCFMGKPEICNTF